MSLNLPTNWRFEIIAPHRDNRVCIISPSGYITSEPRRPVVAWLPPNVQPPDTLRRLFSYSQKISTYGELFGYFDDSEKCLTGIAAGRDTFGKDKLWMWSDSPPMSCRMTFIPLEKGARQPDGPGYLQVKIPSSSQLDGSEIEKLDPAILSDMVEKYMSVDVTDSFHEVELVDLASGPKRSLTWQIQRVDQPHQSGPKWPLSEMGFTAVSWASATLRQVNSMYFLQAGAGGNRIRKASLTAGKWTLGGAFGQVGDVMLAGNTQGLYSLTSDGAVWKYTEEPNITATKISTDDKPFSKLYAHQTDKTLLGIVMSGTKEGNVYSCTQLTPPSWTALTDKNFKTSVAVGSSGSIFAISSDSSVYGEAGAIYQLSGGKAVVIGEASMAAQQLVVITKKFLVAVCPENKAFLYEGAPNSWLDLTLPAVRPWGGISSVLGGVNNDSIVALSGDQKEITYFSPDAHAFLHSFFLDGPAAEIVMEHTGDVQGILGKIGNKMYFVITAIE
ncbi:hypothetical protein CDV55_105305 [Aspergillus turcosus]|uniref:Uncharacterized protein n=1 Tax=Aspergillus turcosus TaxID=1245748 RepID=A0A229XJG7_9EURO|nr:hypothetical protein CDV55_105305 [Aspergillus turcosus]RLL98684.1 hypothetical protein CFD26_105645 [Aspergillus turcosus]